MDAVADAAADAVGNLQDTIEDGTVVAGAAATIKGHDISILTGTANIPTEGSYALILDTYTTSQQYAYFVWIPPVNVGPMYITPTWEMKVREEMPLPDRLVVSISSPPGHSINYTILKVKRTV